MGYVPHTEDYKGYRIRIVNDEDVGNPRKEFDEMGKMICFHGRYNIGDEHTESYEKDPQEFRDWILRNTRRGAIFALAIWMYDHSGQVLRTAPVDGGNPFCGNLPQGHAQFDSGMLGFIYVTKETVRKEYAKKNVTKKCIEKAMNYLRGEIENYNNYLSGNVWGFEIYKLDDNEDAIDDGELVPDDSCYGFWGDWDDENGCLAEAKSVVDNLITREPCENVCADCVIHGSCTDEHRKNV